MVDRRQLLVGFGAMTATGLMPHTLAATDKVSIPDDAVLLVVDVQNCFLPGGSLAVKDGDQVVPVINTLAKKFKHVILTQDWHTPGHVSFASSQGGKKPFETTDPAYGKQVL